MPTRIKNRVILQYSKPAISGWLILVLFLQLIAGAFLPVRISLTPPYLEIQETQAAGEGWISGWSYRRAITLSSATTVANYQVKVQLTAANFDYTKLSFPTTGDDIRFTSSDGSTLQDYWIETWANGGASTIWVEVATSGSSTIYIYYGNPSAASASSGTNTFVRVIGGDAEQPVKGAWTLDDNALDTSGNANHGTLYGGMGYTTGKFGNAGLFDGVDDYVDAGNGASLNITSAITIEAWINGKALSSGSVDFQTIVIKGTRYGIYYEKENNVFYGRFRLSGVNQYSVILPSPLENTWYHLVLSYDSATGISNSYVNGVLTYTYTYSGTINTTTVPVYIGRGIGFFNGSIDEVRIYNRALSAGEISDLYGTGGDRHGYTTTNYPGRVLVRKYAESEPTTSVGSEVSLANIPSNLTLTPNSQTQITASWNANSNPSGTEYFIENTTAGANSGWTTSLSWVCSGLSCGTSYSFRVKAKNGVGMETAWTDLASVSAQSCPGGGMPPGAYNPPSIPIPSEENPQGEFRILINNGDERVNNKTVTLKLYAGADTARMAISNTADFKYASRVPYQREISWELSSCHCEPQRSNPATTRDESNIGIAASSCWSPRNDECTVYVKFYTQYGVSSEAVSDSIILKTIPSEANNTANETKADASSKKQDNPETNNPESDSAKPSPSSSSTFTKTLNPGFQGNEVVKLQDKLKELNFFPQEIKSNGRFGPETKQAVIEYQKSKGINPNSIVGPRTRKALNNEEFITNKEYQFTQDLKYNDKNEDVKQLQTRLRDQNFFPYNVSSTGWFGPVTQAAVNIFQKFYNLIQNGIVDEKTREVLNR